MTLRTSLIVLLPALLLHLCPSRASAQPVQVQLRSTTTIGSSATDQNDDDVTLDQLSGVTFNPNTGTFRAVSDSRGNAVELNVQFGADGSITNAAILGAVSFDLNTTPFDDLEGIAYTNAVRNSVFLSEEDTPGVHEFSLTDGALLQSLSVPTVFGGIDTNRGFESLTRNPAGTLMYTANEEGMSVDDLTGRTVRVLRYNVTGDTATPGEQFAYQVEPIHNQPGIQSGLSDLVALPDGSMLALERSWAGGTDFLTRIFHFDFDGATDVSQGDLADGLLGETFTPVTKTLVYPGNLLNLEGLATGPQLANGDFVLLGVADDQGTSLVDNLVVSFALTVPEPASALPFLLAMGLVLRRRTRCAA